MTVGVNLNALYGTYKDEYVRIRNSGNTNVQFYGVKIGDTKQQMKINSANIISKAMMEGKLIPTQMPGR